MSVQLGCAASGFVNDETYEESGRFRLSAGRRISETTNGQLMDVTEKLAGKAASRAFLPLSITLQAVGAVSTVISSLQQGEPIDVAAVRAGAPVAGSVVGGAAIGTLGAAGGFVLGTETFPGVGSVAGTAIGAVTGNIAGSIGGEALGQGLAEQYARSRGFGGC